MGPLFEIAIGEAFFLAVAIGFNQTHFDYELIQRILQRGADGLIAA